MKKLTKHKVIFLTFFMFICSESIAADRILPLPKPSIDKETKISVVEDKRIYPVEKPNLKKGKTETNSNLEISQSGTDDETEFFIFPQNKPTVVKKEIKEIV